MKLYNQIMGYFWIAVAAISFILVTYNGITQGFGRWGGYYVFTAIAIGMYFMKKWMMKRMENHEAYLKDQQNNQSPKL